jgi:nickel-dependent lactate racemase
VVAGEGSVDRCLTDDEVRRIVRDGLAPLAIDGRRVLAIIPDGTRTMPVPMLFGVLQELLGDRVAALDYLVALGTHPVLTDRQLTRLVGRPVVNGQVGRTRVLNHQWDVSSTFVTLGTIPSREIADLTCGLLAEDVDVSVNRLILDYDHLLICGPVFPHEVAGFSGGNKYFFPGIGGSHIIDATHWLGALVTSAAVIGRSRTPVRAVIDRAAGFIDRPTTSLSFVVTHEGVAGLYVGAVQPAWRAAADLSARKHVVQVKAPFRRALAVMPEMYADLWTAAKGMYKLEPAVADGGEVIIYAPHITEVSYTHGSILDEIGYHCCPFFLADWERFRSYPRAVLAHSTHVKGRGCYDAKRGIETPRINVTLATGIPRERCQRINLAYLDPASIRIEDWAGREQDGELLVRRAGEMLYRLEQDD